METIAEHDIAFFATALSSAVRAAEGHADGKMADARHEAARLALRAHPGNRGVLLRAAPKCATAPAMDDSLLLAGKRFESRLIVGTGKYKNVDETERALDASGAEIVTVALRRVDLNDRSSGSLMALLTRCAKEGALDDPAEHRRLLHRRRGRAHPAPRARARHRRTIVKLEVIGDKDTLYPDNEQTLEAAKILVKEGFTVLPYCIDDPIVCRKLEDLGCAAVMPLAAPIGSGLGIRNPYNLEIILERAKVPVIVDAGVGTASDAAVAMELGCHGVLMNTAIAGAKDPVLMAEAMREAVSAGRKAFLAGRMPKSRYANASSPHEGAHRVTRRRGRALASSLAPHPVQPRARSAPSASRTRPATRSGTSPTTSTRAVTTPPRGTRSRSLVTRYPSSRLAPAAKERPRRRRDARRVDGLTGLPSP